MGKNIIQNNTPKVAMVTDDTYPTDDDIYHLLTAYYVDAIHIFSLILQSCTINISVRKEQVLLQ